jgi:hypothetical protein
MASRAECYQADLARSTDTFRRGVASRGDNVSQTSKKVGDDE